MDDASRLAALQETGLVGTAADETIDRYAQLVRLTLKCDMALVTLLTEDIQYLKSTVGLDASVCPTRQTPASESLCQRVVTGGQPVCISDVREVPGLDARAFACDWELIAYLGTPLRTEDGFVLGSLCAIQKSPREWSGEDVELMRAISDALMAEIRLRMVSGALRESVAMLEVTANERDEMLHMLVHDMRTPLCAVMCALDVLDGDGPLQDEEKELLGAARGGGQQLLGMIDGILATNRLEGEGRGLALEPVDLPLLARHVYRMVSPLADSASVRLVLQCGEGVPHVSADRDFIERLLLNLLTNAIKFSPTGGSVSITVEAEPSAAGAAARIVVRDNGPGVPEADREKIFEKYQRGSADAKGRVSSHGLGLYFCRRVAEAHGGKITVGDAPGGGAEFHVVLPSEPPRGEGER